MQQLTINVHMSAPRDRQDSRDSGIRAPVQYSTRLVFPRFRPSHSLRGSGSLNTNPFQLTEITTFSGSLWFTRSTMRNWAKCRCSWSIGAIEGVMVDIFPYIDENYSSIIVKGFVRKQSCHW
jgi:hypothetical protein